MEYFKIEFYESTLLTVYNVKFQKSQFHDAQFEKKKYFLTTISKVHGNYFFSFFSTLSE